MREVKAKPAVKDDSVQITGLEILQQPPSSQAQPSAPEARPHHNSRSSQPRAKPALSPVRQTKARPQRKKLPPNRTKSCPKEFSGNHRSTENTAEESNTPTTSKQSQVVQTQQTARQAIQQKPLARVTRRGSLGAGLGYSAQPVAPQPQPVQQQQQQQQQLRRVPRRSSMGAAPGYNSGPAAAPDQVQPAKQQRGGQMRRNSVGGAQALPRVSRRVSIGNQEVGVEQVRWGQKPQRRSSLNNTSNYNYAPSAPVQPPQSQVHVADGFNDVSNSSTLSHSSYHGNDGFDFSRRSSLSSHGSDFVENSRGIFHKNEALGYNEDDNDSFASSCFSYANDSVDLRGKKGKNKIVSKRQKSSQHPRRQFDDDDQDSFSSCGDTFADSIDLRRGKQAPRRNSNESLESSCGSTYAADSIDLRRNSKMRQKAAVTDDDLGYSDARPSTAVIEDDLGYGDARPTTAVEFNEDSFTSGNYSYANDSVDMRQLHKKAASGRSAAMDEDLGYGDSRPTSAQAVDLGYGDARPCGAQAADLGYGDAPPRIVPDDDDGDSFSSSCYSYANDSIDMRQMRKKHMAAAANHEDMGYEDARPSSAQAVDLGCGDAIPSSAQQVDLGYGDALPSSAQEIDLGYGDALPSSAQGIDLGYGDAPHLRPEYIDDDDELDSGAESSFGSASYSYAADSIDIRSKRRTATTTNMEDDEDEEEDDEADSGSTPMDYMTRIVMGYCNKEEGDRRNSLESVGADSCYSYACNSVDLRPKKTLAPAATARKEGYDDDSEDYSDDDSSYGNNAYLSSGGLGRGGGVAGEVERRLSCDSLANDSVDLRKFGQKKPAGTVRRNSLDSLTSGFSGGDLDPEYLHSVLGYAMDASSNSLAVPKNVVMGPEDDMKDNSKQLSKKSIESITSKPSYDSDDDLSEDDVLPEEAPIVTKKPVRAPPIVAKKTKKKIKVPRLGRKPKPKKPLERCHSQPMLGRHNKLNKQSSDEDDSMSDDDEAEKSDGEFAIPKHRDQTGTEGLRSPRKDPVSISVL